VRFYAGGREPLSADALFGVAQLDAAATRRGFMARAVTCRGGNALQARGHVTIERDDRQEREDEHGGQANIEGSVGNDGQEQRAHASCWRGSGKKPIAPYVAQNHY
jgi:hypothetical protein